MKKILSQIFSVVLIAATTVSPAMAQMAKKVGAGSSKASVSITTKASSRDANKSMFDGKALQQAKVRSTASKFRTAKAMSSPVRTAVPTKEVSGMPQIVGCVIYNDTFTQSSETGLFLLPNQAGSTQLLFNGPNASNGGVCVDGVYYCTSYFEFWGMVFITTEAYDAESGDQLGSWSPDDYQVMGAGGYALDPATNQVYGITYNADLSGLQLSKLTVSTSEGISAQAVAPIDGNWNSISFDGQGNLYGIRYTVENEEIVSSTLCKIDKTTAAVTEIGQTGCAPKYISGSIIDPATNRMFWNVCPSDETGSMYEVDLNTGAATKLFQLEDNDEIVGMYITVAPEPKAPAACTNVSYNFSNDLSGAVTLTAPTTHYDGTAAAGYVTIHVLANGNEVAVKTVKCGETVTIPVTVSEAGSYNFSVYASNSFGDGKKVNTNNVWVGKDTPAAPEVTLKYADDLMQLSWNPVTTSVNGGTLDPSKVTYNVIRNDGTVAATNLSDTTFSEEVAMPEEMTVYYYIVEAVCDGLVSAAGQSNNVALGSIVPPYTPDFSGDDFNTWTIIDANSDNKTWTVQNETTLKILYNTSLAMDDWLISPAFKLEKGKAYKLKFQSYAQSKSYSERIEVMMGTAPTAEAMTTTIVEPTVIDQLAADPISFETMIVPDADGKYYIGFHGISDKDKYALYISDISLGEGLSANAPDASTNLTVTPDATGALKAKVTFNAPSVNIAGSAISSLSKVEVLRDNVLVKTFDNPTPGQSLTYNDVMDKGGDITYTVIAYNAAGAGLEAKETAFVGLDKPVAPTNVNINRTYIEGQVVLTWDAVTEDVNGLALTPADVKYIVQYNDGGEWVTVAEGLDNPFYTYQAVEPGQQELIQLGVFAQTMGGIGQGTVSDMIPVGTPYNGLTESFANGTLNYVWGLKSISGGTVQLIDDSSFSDVVSADGDDGFIGIYGQYLDSGAELFSGLVSLENLTNPGLTFYTYNLNGDDINEISVSVRTSEEAQWTVLMSSPIDDLFPGQDGWNRVYVNLNDYAGKVIQFQLTGLVKMYTYTLFDNIVVGSTLDYDLSASNIVAPQKAKTGQEFNIDVTVANYGAKDANGAKVELYADGTLVDTKDLESLASGASADVEFTQVMPAIATDEVEYYAKVVYAGDENEANNVTDKVAVSPVISTLPVAVDLKGESTETGIKLTWNEPDFEGGLVSSVTEDFEDADAFSAEYGSWIFVDEDKSPVGGFQGVDVPGITAGSTLGSFWIWDHSQLGNDTFAAHSGDKYLFSLFRYDGGTADEWAISPELSGDAQTISFWAKSYSAQYPEKVEVYYSTGSTEVADFNLVSGSTIDPVSGDWTLYSFDLPAGAKHFAIRSCATDSFMLMVDDVTYTPADGSVEPLTLAGYNVYRDGVKINEALLEECVYVDTTAVEGQEYTYVVTAVYSEKGESAGSNEVTVKYSGSGVNGIGESGLTIKVVNSDIVVTNAEGVKVTVASANGAVVYSGNGKAETVVSVENGVYVVTAGKTVKKVLVK